MSAGFYFKALHFRVESSLQSIIENGSASVTIQITAKDLKDFATHLFETAVRKARAEQASADGEEYLSKAEVMELFGVCDTTLWHWANSNYLKPVKAGRKIFYRKRDVMYRRKKIIIFVNDNNQLAR